MPNTSTEYLGLQLDNPIVVASSSLTNRPAGVKRAADAGAGAVVLKSLFEEQIESEIEKQEESIDLGMHPEAQAYVRQMGMHLGPAKYLDLIAEAKSAVEIPVIASVNCVASKWWGSYGKQVQESGADALELNIAIMPRTSSDNAESIQKRYLSIVEKVRKSVELPLAVKIGPYFTCLPTFAEDLRKAGVSALVLFNRFYQLDIDIEKLELQPGYQFSSEHESLNTLRWISILSGDVGCDLAAATGIHDGPGAVKQLLAGAQVVQICSTVYQNGHARITQIRDFVTEWMEQKGYGSIDDFRALLSMENSGSPEAYERLQYIKALTGSS